MATNYGWQFYRNYYNGMVTANVRDNIIEHDKWNDNGALIPLTKKEKEELEKRQAEFYKKKNEVFKNVVAHSLNPLKSHYHQSKDENSTIFLKTTYPGMLIGTGYAHETGMQGEMKLGFFFDHTTGLPVIPGSTVKGLLRSFFPHFKTPKNSTDVFEIDITDKDYELKQNKALYIRHLLGKTDKWNELSVHKLELHIFEGINLIETANQKKTVYLPMTKRDVFHDAFVAGIDTSLFADDFITPHGENPLKNPIPIGFLKIAPGVTFQFNFDFNADIDFDKANIISQKCRFDICKQILLDNGIGAKTNVGYGQFVCSKALPTTTAPTTKKAEKNWKPETQKPVKEGKSTQGATYNPFENLLSQFNKNK
jgi:CRISPR-associated protein Cmr6